VETNNWLKFEEKQKSQLLIFRLIASLGELCMGRGTRLDPIFAKVLTPFTFLLLFFRYFAILRSFVPFENLTNHRYQLLPNVSRTRLDVVR
jgi:hypothetical protein